LHGRKFDAFKFRTMIPSADTFLEANPQLREEWERNGKIQDDPRITRWGASCGGTAWTSCHNCSTC